jgi:hypothetical protein
LENISFFLYDKQQDSVTLKEKPYYFGKTDKSGQFIIENVKSGPFKFVAVEDLDQNLRWTGALERIGFSDSLLIVSDTGKNTVKLNIFTDVSSLRILDKVTNRYGMVKLVYNAPPDTVHFKSDVPDLNFKTEHLNDTLFVWYNLKEDRAWNLIQGKDTIAIKALKSADFLAKNRPGFLGESRPVSKSNRTKTETPPPATSTKGSTVNQNPMRPAILPFTTPITAYDTSLWRLVLDSTQVRAFSLAFDSTNARLLRLQTNWTQSKTYTLTLLPGAITDYYGIVNVDTLRRIFNVSSDKVMGGLNLTVTKLKAGHQYVLQLVGGNGQTEVETRFESTGADKRLTYTNLPAAQYMLRLIDDQNKNGRWDSGSYFKHQQPEQITIKKMDPLRANWEVEATLEVGGVDKPKPKLKK